jgi:hypothetical protein
VVFATEDGVLSAVIINDTDEVWRSELELSRQDLDGLALAKATVDVSVEPRTTAQIARPQRSRCSLIGQLETLMSMML